MPKSGGIQIVVIPRDGHHSRKPKFGKTRIVDLPAYLVDELRANVRHLQKENLKQGRGGVVDLLFVDPKENGPWPYSQRKVQGLTKKVCKAAGPWDQKSP